METKIKHAPHGLLRKVVHIHCLSVRIPLEFVPCLTQNPPSSGYASR